MGFLDKLRGRDDDPTGPTTTGCRERRAATATTSTDLRGRGDRHPTAHADEEAALEAVRAGYAAHGIDPADLDSIAAAYDRPWTHHGDEDSSSRRRAARHRGRRPPRGRRRLPWVVSTDPFGTDLAVEPPRRGMPVVTRMLVATRWMGRERGWIPGSSATWPDVGRSRTRLLLDEAAVAQRLQRLVEDGLAVGVGAALLHVGEVRLVGLDLAARAGGFSLSWPAGQPAARAVPRLGDAGRPRRRSSAGSRARWSSRTRCAPAGRPRRARPRPSGRRRPGSPGSRFLTSHRC